MEGTGSSHFDNTSTTTNPILAHSGEILIFPPFYHYQILQTIVKKEMNCRKT